MSSQATQLSLANLRVEKRDAEILSLRNQRDALLHTLNSVESHLIQMSQPIHSQWTDSQTLAFIRESARRAIQIASAATRVPDARFCRQRTTCAGLPCCPLDPVCND